MPPLLDAVPRLLELEAGADESQHHDFYAASLRAAAGTAPLPSRGPTISSADASAQAAGQGVFHHAARHAMKPEQLEASLRQCGLGAGAGAAAHLWETQGRGLHRKLLGSALQIGRLVDFEWTFGVSASSSELDSIGATYVQLRFVVEIAPAPGAKAAPTLKHVHAELGLAQFYDFLLELERARGQLDLI